MTLIFNDYLWFLLNKCITELQVSITSKYAYSPFSASVVTVESVNFSTRFVGLSSQGRLNE